MSQHSTKPQRLLTPGDSGLLDPMTEYFKSSGALRKLVEQTAEAEVLEALGRQSARSEQDRARQAIFDVLDELGGSLASDAAVTYEGDRWILPSQMEGNLSGAISFLSSVRDNEETIFEFTKSYTFRPWDGGAAFARAMQRVFGTSGVGKSIFHPLFGEIKPEIKTIEVGVGRTLQIPWRDVGLEHLDAVFSLGADRTEEHGLVFHLGIKAPRKHRRRIEGFLAVIDDELKNRSIYRGQMVNTAEHPGFIDPWVVNRDRVIYSEDVMLQLQTHLWTAIENADWYRQSGVNLKRAVLLEGPYGGGKSLAGILTAQIAVQNGWTFILVRGGEDPYEALKTARVYAPAVVWIEDLDVWCAEKSRDEITELLDALDSASTKGQEVITGFTTNFPDKIERGLLRPGRIDGVINIGACDAAGHEKLIRVTVPTAVLDPEIDFSQVTPAFEGYLPAFTVGAAERAIRYAAVRSGGVPERITAEDLVRSAEGLRRMFEMSSGAFEAKHAKPTLEKLLAGVAEDVNGRTSFEGELFEVAAANGTS